MTHKRNPGASRRFAIAAWLVLLLIVGVRLSIWLAPESRQGRLNKLSPEPLTPFVELSGPQLQQVIDRQEFADCSELSLVKDPGALPQVPADMNAGRVTFTFAGAEHSVPFEPLEGSVRVFVRGDEAAIVTEKQWEWPVEIRWFKEGKVTRSIKEEHAPGVSCFAPKRGLLFVRIPEPRDWSFSGHAWINAYDWDTGQIRLTIRLDRDRVGSILAIDKDEKYLFVGTRVGTRIALQYDLDALLSKS